MNPNALAIIAAIIMVVIVFLNIVVVLSRYTKVGPNQMLIISGRKVQLPDGSVTGFRVVRGGGTFVWPIIEKAEVLSLEVLSVELLRFRARAAGGADLQVDFAAQVKITGDDASIVPATEYFLGKTSAEIKGIVQPVLEKHVVETLARTTAESIIQNPGAGAAAIQTAAAQEIAKMGMTIVSVNLRNPRNA